MAVPSCPIEFPEACDMRQSIAIGSRSREKVRSALNNIQADTTGWGSIAYTGVGEKVGPRLWLPVIEGDIGLLTVY